MQVKNNKVLTWYGRRDDIFFANRPLTGVTITFIRCLNRVTGVSIGQGVVKHEDSFAHLSKSRHTQFFCVFFFFFFMKKVAQFSP